MKRAIIVSAMVLGGLLCAQAGVPNDSYHDILRPDGHKRSNAAFQADVAACQRQAGADRYRRDTPAVKACMLARGYQWQSTTWIETKPAPVVRTSPSDWTDFLPCCGNDPPPTSANNPACPGSIC